MRCWTQNQIVQFRPFIFIHLTPKTSRRANVLILRIYESKSLSIFSNLPRVWMNGLIFFAGIIAILILSPNWQPISCLDLFIPCHMMTSLISKRFLIKNIFPNGCFFDRGSLFKLDCFFNWEKNREKDIRTLYHKCVIHCSQNRLFHSYSIFPPFQER